MIDEYRVALAYSNIQSKFGVPPVLSGVVSYEDDFTELEKRDLPNKKSLIQRKDSLFGLQKTFDDVSQYLTCHIALQLKGGSSLQDFEEHYIKGLNILRSSHLQVIAGRIKSITIRAVDGYDKQSKRWRSLDFDQDFLERVLRFSANYKVVSKGYERLLEVAKILARLEYERLRSFGEEYVTTRIKREPSGYFQIIRMRWNGSPIDEYSDEMLGSPALVIRTPEPGSVQHVYITTGTTVTFSPLAKFCRGSQDVQGAPPCRYHSQGNPFGLPLIGSSAEQCHKCQKLFEYSICLYRKPLCNGYQVKCGNKEFAGNVCCGLFGLYVTRFGSDLKVGTAVLSNVVGRLLEQGAASALILYPIEGIMSAYVLERAVKQHLTKTLDDLHRYGIKNAYRRSPPMEERISDFLQNWDRTDPELFSSLGERISCIGTEIDGLEIDLSQANRKVCRFVRNYVKPARRFHEAYLKPRQYSGPVNGKVVGHRGSVVFLDSGMVVDLKELQGFVVRGKL